MIPIKYDKLIGTFHIKWFNEKLWIIYVRCNVLELGVLQLLMNGIIIPEIKFQLRPYIFKNSK